MKPQDFVTMVQRERASAILRTDDQDGAADAMNAAVAGGFRVIEFTLTVPGVYELIEEFAAREDLVVGAGTVLDAEQAGAAVRAGAKFLVSPIVDETVIQSAHALGVAVIPGCHTPTEMMRAHRAGAQLQKLFPCPAGGPTYLSSMLGPMSFLKVVPTNGVDASNARQWLDAGAFGLGFAATLFTEVDLREKAWGRIQQRAETILAAIHGTQPVA